MTETRWQRTIENTTTAFSERRNNDRCSFIAHAELVDLDSNSRLSARTVDIDRGGCYIDTLNPLRVGTVVKLHLNKDDRSFNIRAEVVYAQHGNGMGLAFAPPEEEQSRTLEEWIARSDATVASNGSLLGSLESSQQATPKRGNSIAEAQQESPLMYLILMLVQKKVLSEMEGKALLERLHV
jgi:hypothetical protein